MLNEELHISNEVKILSIYIKKEILRLKLNKGSIIIDDDKYKNYLSNLYPTKNIINLIFFNKLTINYKIEENINGNGGCNIIDYELLKNDHDKEIVKIKNVQIDLHLGLLGGKPNPSSFDEVIQHEISHVFHLFMKYKKGFYLSKQTLRNQTKYQIAKENAYSDDNYIEILSNIFYYLDRDEQSAFVNGLYSNLINNKPEDITNFLYKTNQYKNLSYFKNLYKNINLIFYNDEWLNAKNLFFEKNITLKQAFSSIKNFLNTEISNYEKKLNGVIRKYQQDINSMKKTNIEEQRKKYIKLLLSTKEIKNKLK